MASKSNQTPDFTAADYIKFFSAGALAATSTHGVCLCLSRPLQWTAS